MSSTTIHLPNNPISPIHVVTAAIVNERDKRLFMQRRSGTTRYPWHWGTPGGALYEDEGVWEGLFRELNEEHGVRVVRQLPFDYVYCHDEPSVITGQITRVRCLYVLSEAIVGPYQVLADAVAGFDWVTAEELERLTPLTPADEANREKLIALIR